MNESLIFVTSNKHKFSEAKAILDPLSIQVAQYEAALKEIQTDDIAHIVEQKAKDAYKVLGMPLFVEHTSLHIRYINDFPAGHTKILLHYFGEEKVCELFGVAGRCDAFAKTTIGYCDGRSVRQFSGTIFGRISQSPRGASSGWDAFGFNRIFILDGYTETLSEMGADKKNNVSMRKLALIELASYILGRK